jgi:quercetin dioxygenase-like cupin family protein
MDLLLTGNVRARQIPFVVPIELRYHRAQITPVPGGDLALEHTDLAPPLHWAESMRRRICAVKGELIRLGDTTVRFLVEDADSGGTVAVFEVGISARGKMPAPHSHDSFEETIYGLEGVSTWTVEDEAVDVAPGEALCIPRGAVHHFDNRGDLEAKALAIVTPGVLGPDYFREVAAVFADSGAGPPDLARIGEVMRRHGLTPAPPPAA